MKAGLHPELRQLDVVSIGDANPSMAGNATW